MNHGRSYGIRRVRRRDKISADQWNAVAEAAVIRTNAGNYSGNSTGFHAYTRPGLTDLVKIKLVGEHCFYNGYPGVFDVQIGTWSASENEGRGGWVWSAQTHKCMDYYINSPTPDDGAVGNAQGPFPSTVYGQVYDVVNFDCPEGS